MKHLKSALSVAVGVLFLAASAQAAVINFSSVSKGATDPTIGPVSFSAGAPAAFNDTYVDDSSNPGNNYLLSGYADGTGISPNTGDAFIGVTRTDATNFGSVQFNIGLINFLPPGSTLNLAAYNGSTFISSTSLLATDYISNGSWYTLTLDLSGTASGADKLFIFDSTDTGDIFAIDNFSYTNYVQQCTGPNCGGNVPEPSALLLLGLGLMGMVFASRRKSV